METEVILNGHDGPDLYLCRTDILPLLKLEGDGLKALYEKADQVRHAHMGDDVYIRGIIEFSNICTNDCLYCGIRASNYLVNRYTMAPGEIFAVARAMISRKQSTVVLQSGETPGISDKGIGDVIKQIKDGTPLAVTVSAGNRPPETYKYWKDCGMDRYLLRFETSNPRLFERLHPDCTLEERIDCLLALKEIGVQTGSGFMIGLPGETVVTLADNILLCHDLDLDMIGIGPFIPHPNTPLADEKNSYAGDKEMFFRAVAVLRLVNPDAHIPATTAFDAAFPGAGRDLVLQRGANVFMPNDTPAEHKKDYLLYPGKTSVDEDPGKYTDSVFQRIESLGRRVGIGPGHSIKWKKPDDMSHRGDTDGKAKQNSGDRSQETY